MHKVVSILLGFLLFSSCQDQPVYSKSMDLENAQWRYGNPAVFDFDISDTLQRHDLILRISHDREFDTQNFYTQFTTIYPDKRKIEDVVSIELSDNFGKWLGSCSGENCTVDILLQPSVRFQEIGNYQITIAQHTRNAVLSGIQALELRLMKLEG